MCVRTKTSYGCGHEFKTTADCHSSRCQGLERYHYPKKGDCRDCKQGGEAITRGREGKGRYAQEISRRGRPREQLAESVHGAFPNTSEVGGGISPWAAPSTREKEWQGDWRKRADDAWLQEHVERSVDLQTIRDTVSSCAPSERGSPIAHSPVSRGERIYVYEDDPHYIQDDDRERHHGRDPTERSLQIEIRSFHDDHDRRSHRPVSDRRRHDSQESFESMHSMRSSTRKHTPARSYASYEYREPYDSGYGSYGSRASNGYETAKTEPYLCSPPLRTMPIKLPPPPPPPPPPPAQPYGVYQSGFGIGGVDIATRSPMYAYSSRRH